eukprot:1175866-Prorocentrum_minimum.AAC.1
MTGAVRVRHSPGWRMRALTRLAHARVSTSVSAGPPSHTSVSAEQPESFTVCSRVPRPPPACAPAKSDLHQIRIRFTFDPYEIPIRSAFNSNRISISFRSDPHLISIGSASIAAEVRSKVGRSESL